MYRLLIILLFTISYQSVWALSCRAPVLSNDIIDKSEIAFLGEIVKVKKSIENKKNKENVTLVLKEQLTFKVLKHLKGVKKGQIINVFRNAYWGSYENNKEKHIVIPIKKNGEYWSPLCSSTLFYHTSKMNLDIFNNYKAKQ